MGSDYSADIHGLRHQQGACTPDGMVKAIVNCPDAPTHALSQLQKQQAAHLIAGSLSQQRHASSCSPKGASSGNLGRKPCLATLCPSSARGMPLLGVCMKKMDGRAHDEKSNTDDISATAAPAALCQSVPCYQCAPCCPFAAQKVNSTPFTPAPHLNPSIRRSFPLPAQQCLAPPKATKTMCSNASRKGQMHAKPQLPHLRSGASLAASTLTPSCAHQT